MIRLFGVNLAKVVGDAFSGQLPTITLVRIEEGGRLPGRLTSGNLEAKREYQCDGVVSEDTAVIIAASLPAGVEPREDDRIVFNDREQIVESIAYDPAKAAYECQLANN